MTYGSLALAFGLLSLCCCGFVFGSLSLHFGGFGLKKDEDRSLSIIGLFLGIIGTFCGILFFLFFLSILWSTPA